MCLLKFDIIIINRFQKNAIAGIGNAELSGTPAGEPTGSTVLFLLGQYPLFLVS
jgi:hypothetical protein